MDGVVSPGDPFTDGSRLFGGAGLDLKWGATSSMTLDATVNPDFGQVEVDPAVVNLTAFETFYEEPRPFFIEGIQAFDSFGRNGASGYMGFNRSNPSLFYSRRIGRTPQGAAPGKYVDRPASTTIVGAAKVTGKTSRGWTVNFIDAVTAREYARTSTAGIEGKNEVEPFSNYLAACAWRVAAGAIVLRARVRDCPRSVVRRCMAIVPRAGEVQTVVARRGGTCLAVICGRQVRASDGLEVLALGTCEEFPDGLPFADIVSSVCRS